MSDDQLPLLKLDEWWEEHWKGMPEFVQKDLMPLKTIYVHFETRHDLDAFARLVNQTITMDTRSIWYPEMTIDSLSKKRYIDAPPADVDDGLEVIDGDES